MTKLLVFGMANSSTRLIAVRTLFFVLIFTIYAPITFSQNDIIPISNYDILVMLRNKIPPGRIIARINNSSCDFDIFPHALAELRYQGVPDEVLRAMVKAPHGRQVVIEQLSEAPRPANNTILSGRSETPYNARFYVATMDAAFDAMVSSLLIQRKLPLRVVADENLADFVVVLGRNSSRETIGVSSYERVSNGAYERPVSNSRNERDLTGPARQGNVSFWVIRMRDQAVICVYPSDEGSMGTLSNGTRKSLAEKLVNKLKRDLFR